MWEFEFSVVSPICAPQHASITFFQPAANNNNQSINHPPEELDFLSKFHLHEVPVTSSPAHIVLKYTMPQFFTVREEIEKDHRIADGFWKNRAMQKDRQSKVDATTFLTVKCSVWYTTGSSGRVMTMRKTKTIKRNDLCEEWESFEKRYKVPFIYLQ